MIRICLECGNEFEGWRNQYYCCDECRMTAYKKAAQARYQKQKTTRGAYTHHKKEKHKSRINELNAKARELGLTYGQYQALKYKEAQNG